MEGRVRCISGELLYSTDIARSINVHVISTTAGTFRLYRQIVN